MLCPDQSSEGAMPDVDRGVRHTRAVLYLRGVGWVVVDRIATDRPCRITPLWHLHPDGTVVRDEATAAGLSTTSPISRRR